MSLARTIVRPPRPEWWKERWATTKFALNLVSDRRLSHGLRARHVMLCAAELAHPKREANISAVTATVRRSLQTLLVGGRRLQYEQRHSCPAIRAILAASDNIFIILAIFSMINLQTHLRHDIGGSGLTSRLPSLRLLDTALTRRHFIGELFLQHSINPLWLMFGLTALHLTSFGPFWRPNLVSLTSTSLSSDSSTPHYLL